MTVREIMHKVGQHKRCSRGTLYAYLRKFEIHPVGSIRQKPQQYPDDAAARILTELGLKVVSMPQLRRERAKAQKSRAA